MVNEDVYKRQDHTHIPNGMAADPGEEGRRYDELIRSLGGVDIQLLGIGHTGHIGFNEPNTYLDVYKRQIMQSVRRLAALPGDWRVYPGHGPETTMKRERLINPYLQDVYKRQPCYGGQRHRLP